MAGEVIPPAAQSPRSDTILIVEDDADIGVFLQHLIEEETPYRTVVISNGFQAWKRLQKFILVSCFWIIDCPG